VPRSVSHPACPIRLYNRDFSAPKPCPYDASAATIAACGLLKLSRLLSKSDPASAEKYLARAFKLIEDTLRECAAPAAKLEGGSVDFGDGGWETILMHSTINGNPKATRQFMDHGLICESCFLGSVMLDETKADIARCGLLSAGVR
jgi:hypothetical protein